MIDEIKNHFYQLNFEKAVELINQLPKHLRLQGRVFESAILFIKGRYHESIELTDQILELSKKNNDWALLGSSFVKWDTGSNFRFLGVGFGKQDHEKMRDIINIYRDIDSYEVQEWISLHYSQLAVYDMIFDSVERSFDSIDKALELSLKINSPLAECMALKNYAQLYLRRNDFHNAWDHLEKALKIAVEHNYLLLQMKIQIDLCSLDSRSGNFEKTESSLNELLKKSIDFDSEMITEEIYKSLASNFERWGRYHDAINYLNKLYAIDEKKQLVQELRVLNIEIGRIKRIMGELNDALTHFKTSYEIAREFDIERGISGAQFYMGTVLFEKGELGEALEMFIESYQGRMQLDVNAEAAQSLLQIILVLINLGDLTRAKAYFSFFDNLLEDPRSSSFGQIENNYILAKASILKSSKRMKAKVEALELFEEFSKKKDIGMATRSFVLINICDLLLEEYKSTEEEEIMVEIKEISNRLYKLGKNNNSPTISVQGLILISKLNLIEGNFDEVDENLEKAGKIAQASELTYILSQVEREYDRIREELRKWKIIGQTSLEKRLEHSGIEHYVKQAQRLIKDGFDN